MKATCLSMIGIACALSGCVTLPNGPAERSLYLDLRKIVDANEDGGWTVDWLRLQANAEPALRSACQVEPQARAALDAWLGDEIQRVGGPAEQQYLSHGKNLEAVAQEEESRGVAVTGHWILHIRLRQRLRRTAVASAEAV